MAERHPQTHLWPALQRRFGDQNSIGQAPERLLRGLCISPLDGQEESSVWTLGFRENGATMRTASLARDFSALSAMIDPKGPCYLAVFVGDVPERPASAGPNANWLLISYVPSTCTSFEARKMADNRAGLKAGLGAEFFTDGGLWCVHTDQISLSNYMRSLDASSAGAGAPGSPGSSPQQMSLYATGSTPAADRSSAAAQQELAAAKIQGIARKNSQTKRYPGADDGGATPGLGLSEARDPLADATEAIWEERIKGVRHAYFDSCSRLVSSLEELEQTLCGLTGDHYRQDAPVLRARAHLAKNLELMR